MFVQVILVSIFLWAHSAFVLPYNSLVMLHLEVIFRVSFMSKRPPTDVAPMFGVFAIDAHMRLQYVFSVKSYVATRTFPFDFVMLIESENIVISLVLEIRGTKCAKLSHVIVQKESK